MMMGFSRENCRLGIGIKTALTVATETIEAAGLFVVNSISNRTRDQAWRMGDQAMRKASFGSTRGQF
jgi:5-carboxymethyl-2-hydroxymuconate isomerase